MKYHLILINDHGVMTEHTEDLPVEDSVSWHDFSELSRVRHLLLLNPTMRLHDVTPDGMPDWYTDEQLLRIQLQHQGLRKSQKDTGATIYEDLDQDA